jgi:hypothetical protein
LLELLKENDGINGIATEFRLLLTIGAGFELSEELLGLVKLLELSNWYGFGYDDGYGEELLLAIGTKLELPEELLGLVKLLELLEGDVVGNDGTQGNKLPPELMKENDGINGITVEFRLLLTIGVELELSEELLGLVKLLELLEGDEVGYSEVGGIYEDVVNDDGNISGNTDVGG